MNAIQQAVMNGVRPQPPQMVLAQPMNDVQLVCLMAAQLNDRTSARARVDLAVEIVVEAIHQMAGKDLARLAKAKNN